MFTEPRTLNTQRRGEALMINDVSESGLLLIRPTYVHRVRKQGLTLLYMDSDRVWSTMNNVKGVHTMK